MQLTHFWWTLHCMFCWTLRAVSLLNLHFGFSIKCIPCLLKLPLTLIVESKTIFFSMSSSKLNILMPTHAEFRPLKKICLLRRIRTPTGPTQYKGRKWRNKRLWGKNLTKQSSKVTKRICCNSEVDGKNMNGRNFLQTAFRKRCVGVSSGLTTYWQILCIYK